MKLHDDPEADSLYVELRTGPNAQTREAARGLNADIDAAGEVVRFDPDLASTRFDLSELDAFARQLAQTAAA